MKFTTTSFSAALACCFWAWPYHILGRANEAPSQAAAVSPEVLPVLPACGARCISTLAAPPSSASPPSTSQPPPSGFVTPQLCFDMANVTGGTQNNSSSSSSGGGVVGSPPSFSPLVQACLLAQCSPADALDTLRTLSGACRWPARSRKASLLLLFAVQIPAVACLVLRLYGRCRLAARLTLDDCVVWVMTPIFVAFLIVGQYAAVTGFGVDIWTVPSDDIVKAMRAFYVDESLYIAVLALTKLSVLALYLRLFEPDAQPRESAASSPERRRRRRLYRARWFTFRWAVHALAAWVALSAFLFLLLTVFQCQPVDVVWTRWTSTDLPGTGTAVSCIDVRALADVAAAFSIAQDVLVLLLPWPLLVLLVGGSSSTTATATTTLANKVTTVVMFSLGVFVLVTACVRLRYLVRFDTASANPTWDNTDSLVWSGLEVSVSVVVISLPMVRVLCARGYQLWRESRRRARRRVGFF